MPATILKSRPQFSGILRETETFAVPDDTSFSNRLNSWFDKLMLQSGLGLSPTMVLLLCLCGGLTLGGAVFVWQENLLTSALGMLIGFLIPLIGAIVARTMRQSQMTKQLPGMIDELSRAAKTGRSLENCLAMVAQDTPSPLGGELRHVTRKLALGLSLDESLRELPERTGLVATSVLATALSVHRQTGGDLVRVLERLARTLRSRAELQGRLKAATAGSRAFAILAIGLPPAIITFFVFRDPNYLTQLFDSTWGLRVTVLAFVLDVVGAIWFIRILQKSQQA